MTTSFARSGWQLPRTLLIVAILTAATAVQSPHAAEFLTVRLDQARIARLPDGVATIVVGNPLIADVSLQQGGLMVLTGKGYGVTNLIALDRGGTVLSEQSIQVQGPTDGIVVVYRGVERESYSCTPRCERRITLGDSAEFFDTTISQTGTRTNRAQGVAAPAAPAPAR
jgi:Flp pilus assembly secretin CpaC